MEKAPKKEKGVKKAYTQAACALALILAGCTGTPSPAPSTTVVVSHPLGPKPVKGWIPEYDRYIRDVLPGSLLEYEPTSFCPKFSQVDRFKFWTTLFKSLAYAESGFDRTTIYSETTMGPDSVTGATHVQSIGLLQLSYSDAKYYRGCDFDWAKDKQLDLVERSIMDPYLNLKCGMSIAARLVTRYPRLYFADAMGKYWSTIRPGKAKLRQYFDKQMPECR